MRLHRVALLPGLLCVLVNSAAKAQVSADFGSRLSAEGHVYAKQPLQSGEPLRLQSNEQSWKP